jgi:hypothetical protein
VDVVRERPDWSGRPRLGPGVVDFRCTAPFRDGSGA